jgi:hypothetical protein
MNVREKERGNAGARSARNRGFTRCRGLGHQSSLCDQCEGGEQAEQAAAEDLHKDRLTYFLTA